MDTNERTNERTDGRTNGNFAFFSIFGGVLRTAAKNRKKCFRFGRFGQTLRIIGEPTIIEGTRVLSVAKKTCYILRSMVSMMVVLNG